MYVNDKSGKHMKERHFSLHLLQFYGKMEIIDF